MSEEAKFYQLPFYGIATAKEREVVLDFLEKGGLQRTVEAFYGPAIRRPRPEPMIQLEELARCLEPSFPASLEPADMYIRRQWSMFRSDAQFALAERRLIKAGEVNPKYFVGDVDLYRSAQYLAQTGRFSQAVDPATLRCGPYLRYPVFPSGAALQPSADNTPTVQFYEYRKSPPTLNERSMVDFMKRFQVVAITLTNSDTRTLLTELLVQVFNVPDLKIPPPSKIKLNIVTANRNFIPSEPKLIGEHLGVQALLNQSLYNGLRIDRFAYFILNLLTNRLPSVGQPTDHFQPITTHS